MFSLYTLRGLPSLKTLNQHYGSLQAWKIPWLCLALYSFVLQVDLIFFPKHSHFARNGSNSILQGSKLLFLLIFFFFFSPGKQLPSTYPISHCCHRNFLYKDAKIHKPINTSTLQKWLENKKPVSQDCQGWNNYFPSGQKADSWHSHIFHMEWGDTHPWDRQWVGVSAHCLQGKTGSSSCFNSDLSELRCIL